MARIAPPFVNGAPRRFKLLFGAVIGACFCVQPALADDDGFIEWHKTNLQVLRGFDYELGSKQRTILTLEHANRWKYGDFFVFLDQTIPDQGAAFFYIEPTLRFSLSKITGRDLSYGIVKDVLLTTSFEKPKGQRVRFLGGMSIDLDLPGFKFFKTNFWHVTIRIWRGVHIKLLPSGIVHSKLEA